MYNLIMGEFLKLKKNSILAVLFTGAFFPIFVTAMQVLMSHSVEAEDLTFMSFFGATIWNNFSIAFPFMITLIAGMMFNQEYLNDTLKSLICIPISIKKLMFAKLIAVGVLVIILGVLNATMVCILAFIFGFSNLNMQNIIGAYSQICISGFCVFLSVTPLIIWASKKVNRYYLSVGIAFFYGFCSIFAVSKGWSDYYPVTAGLRIAGYFILPGGNIEIAFLSLSIVILLSVLEVFIMPFSYENGIQFEKK